MHPKGAGVPRVLGAAGQLPRRLYNGPRLLGHDPDARWEDLCGMVYVPRDEANMSRVPEQCRPGHDGRAASIDLTGD